MSDYKVDSIQVGSISKAISENIDGELILKDSQLPQGVSLSNLLSDVSYAQQIQENVDAYLVSAIEVAVENISAGLESIGEQNAIDIVGLSTDLYNGTYETYILENSSISDKFVDLNVVNNFTNNLGINKETPESQLHIQNKPNEDPVTSIILDNTYPDQVGAESTTYSQHKSSLKQIHNTLHIANNTFNGQVRIYNENPELIMGSYEGGLRINSTEVITSSTLLLETSSIDGSTSVQSATGGSAVLVSVEGFKYIKEGAKIIIGSEERFVDKVVSDSEIEVLSISGFHSMDIQTGESFSYQNPLLESKDLVFTVDDSIGIGTKVPMSRIHIKDSNSLFLDSHNPNIYFGNREDTFGKISYNFTSDAITTEGFSLDLNSSKLDNGSSIKLRSVSVDARLNSVPSGEIQFWTTPYTYEDSVEEELRMSLNTYGNLGINNTNPLSRLHVTETSQTLTGSISVAQGSNTVTGSNINDQNVHQTEFTRQVGIGDKITVFGQTRTVTQIVDDFTLIVDINYDTTADFEIGQVLPAIIRLDNGSGNIFKVDNDGHLLVQEITCSELNSLGDIITNGDLIAENDIIASGNISTTENLIVSKTITVDTVIANGDITTQGHITTVGMVSGANITATGMISGAYIAGDGSQLTNLNVGSIQNLTTSGVISGANLTVTGTVSGSYIAGDGSQLTNLPGIKKFKGNIGDGVNNPITLYHNMNTEDIVVSVKDNISKQIVGVDVIIDDENNITLLFTDIPTFEQYTVTVIG
jgi:hypothetical protein